MTAQNETLMRQEIGIKSPSRVKRIIRELIADLNLDMSGLVVLTEAASGNYIFTPLIAAMANASKVIAITKDSRYGKARNITENTFLLADYFGIEKEKFLLVNDLAPYVIAEADIVTNLGFLRPIDKKFISSMKPTAVIPLMYETWEFREEDLDLRECWRKGIPVLGTNEEHKALRIFEYIGHLCLKILFEAEIEVVRSRIILVGDNKFSKNIVKTLSSAGANVLWATNLKSEEFIVQKNLRDCDAIIVNTYPNHDVVIGENGFISAEKLKELAPGITIVQFNGLVERESVNKYGLTCVPSEEPKAGHMGWTLAYLGPKPVIALNCGGLKVGELLAKARSKGLDRIRAEEEALKNGICQSFSVIQRKKYER